MILKYVEDINGIANIRDTRVRSELIDKILHMDSIDNYSINEFEEIRKNP